MWGVMSFVKGLGVCLLRLREVGQGVEEGAVVDGDEERARKSLINWMRTAGEGSRRSGGRGGKSVGSGNDGPPWGGERWCVVRWARASRRCGAEWDVRRERAWWS